MEFFSLENRSSIRAFGIRFHRKSIIGFSKTKKGEMFLGSGGTR